MDLRQVRDRLIIRQHEETETQYEVKEYKKGVIQGLEIAIDMVIEMRKEDK